MNKLILILILFLTVLSFTVADSAFALSGGGGVTSGGTLISGGYIDADGVYRSSMYVASCAGCIDPNLAGIKGATDSGYWVETAEKGVWIWGMIGGGGGLRGPIPTPTTLTFTGTYAGTTGTILTVPVGEDVVLNWRTTNVSRCTASDGWIDDWTDEDQVRSGYSTQSVTANTTFSLECWNTSSNTPRSLSTGKKSVVVTVGAACVPTGLKTYGECSALCGGGTRTVTDSCGKVSNESCNTQPCVSICTPDCSQASRVCTGQTFTDANRCGTDNCTGTRSCDYNWKEVAP